LIEIGQDGYKILSIKFIKRKGKQKGNELNNEIKKLKKIAIT
jgi:hypothetical protein